VTRKAKRYHSLQGRENICAGLAQYCDSMPCIVTRPEDDNYLNES
jgi:hypothetical protein